MRVQNDELYDFIRDFGRHNANVTRVRMLAVLKGRFYGREDARQLIYRMEGLGLIMINEECITIKIIG